MDTAIREAILRISREPFIDPHILHLFQKQLDAPKGLIRDENPEAHFGSMFVPLDEEKKKIFLGHHVKASDWIVPGGHIDPHETPVQTVVRECKEELYLAIDEKDVIPFNMAVKDVSSGSSACKKHFDLWYIVPMHERELTFDRREYYDGGWFTLDDAVQKMQTKEYNVLIRKLQEKLSL